MPIINLVLADEQQLVLDAWKDLLNRDEHFTVAGTANTADAALSLVSKFKPVVVLCDIDLRPIDGIELTPLLQKMSPSSKIIGISAHSSPVYARKMMKAGAMGYVTKKSSFEELRTAILEVAAGNKYICEETKNLLVQQSIEDDLHPNPMLKLTKKELGVINGLKEGLSSKEIALKNKISYKTVETHRYNILKKLKLPNTAALISYMYKYEI
jgi:DNA-binding NarL/FixJ family response regulator